MRVLPRTAPARTATRTAAAVAAVAALTASLTVGSSTAGASGSSGSSSGASEQALEVVGLAGKGTRLISFSTDEPGKRRAIGRITGLSGGDTRLVGIDFRVQDGLLYGVGDEGGVYRFDRGPRATRLSNPALPLDDSTSFGVDFNPAANALRVISAQGQNLRLPLATEGAAAVVDSPADPPRGPGHDAAQLRAGPRADGRGVHQQRPRPDHRHDAVRHRHRAQPGGAAVARPTAG